MLSDPIIEELHHIRQEYAAQFDFDMDAIVRHMQQEQSNGGREVTSLAKIDLRQAFAEVEAHKQGKIVLPTLSDFF